LHDCGGVGLSVTLYRLPSLLRQPENVPLLAAYAMSPTPSASVIDAMSERATSLFGLREFPILFPL